MIPTSSIVAIDDNQDELDAIMNALRSIDLACLPVKVTAAKPNVARPLTGVRLVFFDINYLAGTSNEAILFETAATVLEKVLAPDNGPYVLVTWSTKSDKHDALMQFFAEKVPEIPTPAMSGYLRKERFINAASDLASEIRSVLGAQPQVEALMQWEGAARRAAGDVINSLLELTPRDARFLGTAGTDLHGLLAKVANNAVGPANAAADRRGAVHEALVPILFDRLIHQVPEDGEIDLWSRAIDFEKAPATDKAHQRKLNGLSHIAREVSALVAGDRGVVFTVAPSAGQLMADRTGLQLTDIAGDFVAMPTDKKGNRQPVDVKLLEEHARWVFIGVRAICDQAQSKGTLKPVVLALEIPADWEKLKGQPMQHQGHGAICISPPFSVPSSDDATSTERKLLIDWHWTLSLSTKEVEGAEKLYRVREPLMSQITSQMSSYISRPGIIDYTAKA